MTAAKPDSAYQPVGVIAAVLDLTERRVQQLVLDGVLPKPAHGYYSVLDCMQSYVRHLRAKIDGSNAPAERARLLSAQREKVEIEVAALRRDLIPAAEVRDVIGRVIGNARSILLAIEARTRGQFGDAIADVVREEHDRALTEIARGTL